MVSLCTFSFQTANGNNIFNLKKTDDTMISGSLICRMEELGYSASEKVMQSHHNASDVSDSLFRTDQNKLLKPKYMYIRQITEPMANPLYQPVRTHR